MGTQQPLASGAAGHDLLAGLNTAQARAVTHDGGPAVVLAGPGTGKTRVIIHRLAYAMRERGLAPERMVALTFTTKAAEEMRQRLSSLVGVGLADRVQVHTFHGFGLRMVRRYADLMGLPPDPELIDSAQRRRLLRELIFQHDLLREWRGLAADGVVVDAEAAVSALSEQAIEAEAAQAFVSRRAAELAQNNDGLERLELEAEQAKLRRFEDVAKLAVLFARACAERGWVSFSDFISLPTRLLRRHSTAAALVRSAARHIVVDEFQDVNAGQIEFLRLLAPPGAGGEAGPDLCVVGDDDQAIYEFRGADDRAFAKFARIWPGSEVIALTENFRSARPILAVANAIITQAGHERFAPDKLAERPSSLKDQPDEAGAGVLAVKLPQDTLDGDVIAMMVLTQRAREPERRYREFAVLARNGGDLDRVAAGLELEGIPVARRRRKGLLEEPGIKDVWNWMELLVNARASWAARWLLVRPPAKVEPARMAEWERAYAAQRSRHESGAEATDDPGAFVAWLAARASDEPAVERLARQEAELRGLAATQRADEVVFRIMTLTDVAHADLTDGRARARRVARLAAVLRFVRERQHRLDAPGDLAAFWAYLQDLADAEKEIEGGSSVDGEPQQVEGDDGDPERDAVQLVTAHSAKGLEFDTVFVTRVGQHGFPSVRSDEAVLPEGLVDRAGDTRDTKARRQAEERRLFYVACTRAERRLVILGKQGKTRSSGVNFMDELVRDRAAEQLVTVLESADVWADAAEAGVGSPARGELDRAGAGFDRLGKRREALIRARREARLEAATALDAADRAGLTPAGMEELLARLRDAAGRLALAAEMERNGKPAAWITGDATTPSWQKLAAVLGPLWADEVAGKGAVAAGGVVEPRWAGQVPPLRLSYSVIDEYLRCPRCYYLKHVLRIPEADHDGATLGSAAHQALEQFYRQFAEADADGRDKPGLDRLMELGKKAFFRLAGNAAVKPEELKRLMAQLEMTFTRLHGDGDHVLEQEKHVQFAYPSGGHEHRFSAHIDRVDQAPDGRLRVIDYKTGYPKKSLLEPSKDDLQMGIYALALASQADGCWPEGTAEYWLLSTGQRGVIDLAALKADRIRAKIDEAVDGMLKGAYRQGKGCLGLCEILGPE